MKNEDVLDISPIDPPLLGSVPDGVKIDFNQVVADAEMQNVATTNFPSEIRIHEADYDYVAILPGRITCCISECFLPTEKKARAREIIRRLAYGFHDYAAREIAANYHRELKKANGGYERI